MPDVYFNEMCGDLRYVLTEAGRPLIVGSLCSAFRKSYGASRDDVLAALRRLNVEYLSDGGLDRVALRA